MRSKRAAPNLPRLADHHPARHTERHADLVDLAHPQLKDVWHRNPGLVVLVLDAHAGREMHRGTRQRYLPKLQVSLPTQPFTKLLNEVISHAATLTANIGTRKGRHWSARPALRAKTTKGIGFTMILDEP